MKLKKWLLKKLRAAVGAYMTMDALKGHIDQQTAELRKYVPEEVAGLKEQMSELTELRLRIDDLASALQNIERLHNETTRLATAIEQVQTQLPVLHDRLYKLVLSNEDYSLDVISTQFRGLDSRRLIKLGIVTSAPLAVESDDHKFPRGTKNDNTRHPRFVLKCEKVLGKKIFHLDLGCAGGGLVWDFILAGHQSYGIDGSDYSLINQRALWRLLPGNLFTADITKPFYFVDESGGRQHFDLITAWEVLEHLREESLPGLFTNLHNNLCEEGLFVASIATFGEEDRAVGAVYHVTVRPQTWWMKQFENAGFERVEGLFDARDYVRGSGNPRADDWDVATTPDLGFHVVLRRSQAEQRV